MRLAGLIAALALAAPAAAAGDQTTVLPSAAPMSFALAPGEVLLEIDATGRARTRPDLATVFATAKSQGATPAAARAANAALVVRITEAARRAGVAPDDIREGSNPWSRFGFVGNEALEGGGPSLPALARPTGKAETTALEIRVRDVGRIDAVSAAVEEAGADQVTGPFYSLENDAAARRSAKADAVARARAEAEDYARALGMRVVRILRVSERSLPLGGGDAMEAVLYSIYGFHGPLKNEVETTANLAVDFALAPAQ